MGVYPLPRIPLTEDPQVFVAMNTHKGLFKYTRLPFGVALAPVIFQCLMETLLQGLQGVCMYLDYILVTGNMRASP